MAFAFDTLAQAKRLREAGFDERQAEALAGALRDAATTFDASSLATKADLDALSAATRADLDAVRAATRADLDALRAATKADLDALRAATRADLTAGLAALKADLLQWIIGLIAGAVVLNAFVVIGSIFGIARLMAH
jgi:hypothetical protein